MHRDIKPANIKSHLRDASRFWTLDLRKRGRSGPSRRDLSQTVTQSIGTEPGMILGTPPYMSPEQARGHAIDHRTDIWAFGCVLYELLTAKRAFTGSTLPDLMGAVLANDPDWDALPKDTPERIRALLRRCLLKNADERLRHIGEARTAVELVQAGQPGISWRSVAALAATAIAMASP